MKSAYPSLLHNTVMEWISADTLREIAQGRPLALFSDHRGTLKRVASFCAASSVECCPFYYSNNKDICYRDIAKGMTALVIVQAGPSSDLWLDREHHPINCELCHWLRNHGAGPGFVVCPSPDRRPDWSLDPMRPKNLARIFGDFGPESGTKVLVCDSHALDHSEYTQDPRIVDVRIEHQNTIAERQGRGISCPPIAIIKFLIPVAALAALGVQIVGFVQDVYQLKQRVAVQESEMGHLKNELAATENEVSRLNSETAVQESEMSHLKNRLAATEQEVSRLNSEVEKVEIEIGSCQEELAVNKHEVDHWKEGHQSLTKAMSVMHDHLTWWYW